MNKYYLGVIATTRQKSSHENDFLGFGLTKAQAITLPTPAQVATAFREYAAVLIKRASKIKITSFYRGELGAAYMLTAGAFIQDAKELDAAAKTDRSFKNHRSDIYEDVIKALVNERLSSNSPRIRDSKFFESHAVDLVDGNYAFLGNARKVGQKISNYRAAFAYLPQECRAPIL